MRDGDIDCTGLIATFRKERHQIVASCTQSRLVVTCQPGSANYPTLSGRLELVLPFCPFFACRGELIAWRMRAVTCMRARKNRAFRVPSGTPSAAAASE